ncbi:MAG: P-loop NTPase fold protein [Lachnospiraceae bacterium]|nr:P-loop NTPase fold protein [Lachnospiraceae bacterium]
MKNKVRADEKDLKLVSTAPVCDRDKYGDYADILHQQILAPDVYNIGIIAPYGAGKSSLIKTYKDTKYKERKRKNVTTISLANFNSSDSVDDDEDFEKHIQDIECNVEKSILQQFIYKV